MCRPEHKISQGFTDSPSTLVQVEAAAEELLASAVLRSFQNIIVYLYNSILSKNTYSVIVIVLSY